MASGVHQRYVDVDGVRTRFYESGEGHQDVVVLIHGGEPGQTPAADVWRSNIAALGARYHVLAPDRIGQGYTENFAAETDVRITTICRHVIGFVRGQGVRSATFVGQSRGGYVVAQVAMSAPDLVERVVLTNSSSLAPGVGSRYYRNDFGKMLGGPEHARRDLEWLSVGHDYLTDTYVDDVVAMLSADRQVRARELFSAARDAYYEEFDARKQEVIDWLAGGGLRTPVLVVWGIGDPMTYPDGGQVLFDLVRAQSPYARMYVIDRCGHLPFAEHPDEFNGALVRFIEASR